MRKSRQQERGEKKTSKQTQKKKLTKMLEEKRTTPHPQFPNPKERFTPRAKPGGKNTHNERTSTSTPAFFSFFLSRSIAVDTTGLRTSGKKKKNPRLALIREMRLPKAKGKEVGGGGELCSCCCWKEIPNGQKACPRFSQARFLLLHVSF
jgi:hypothetical protein